MKLRYIDHRPIRFKSKRKGIIVMPNPRVENIFDAEENEARRLLKMKNGTKPCWEKVETRRPRQVQEESE